MPSPTPERPARCGTTSGWRRHLRLKQKPCDACARAKAEYDKRWRSAPLRTLKNRLSSRAQSLALADLKNKYLDEYNGLYAEHKARLWEENGITKDGQQGNADPNP